MKKAKKKRPRKPKTLKLTARGHNEVIIEIDFDKRLHLYANGCYFWVRNPKKIHAWLDRYIAWSEASP